MADQIQPVAISAAFPVPPPFYKSFTTQNLKHREEYLESTNHSPSEPLSISSSGLNLLSLPPELRNLFPPPPPRNGKYRSFGQDVDISPTASTENQTTPTPSSLHALTHNLLLSFLNMTHALATNPGGYASVWDELHKSFEEVHKVINGYRPHQARETLVLMMEQQIEKVRAETKAVQESVGRAREVIEGLGKRETTDSLMSTGISLEARMEGKKRKREEDGDKRVWEVLEMEVGRL